MPSPVRRARLVLDAWPLLAAVVLVWPLVTGSGYPLARDLVFVPHQPLTDAALGAGASAPRAVPLDAVMALLTTVVDGEVLARVALPLILAAAGWGAHRLVGDLGLVPRLVAGGLAVWNPYVVERLALGQWALLAAYAALPWLVMASTRHRRTGELRDLCSVVLWLALASITPTGGVLGLATVLVCGLRGRHPVRLVAAALALQLPWLLPSFVGAAGLTSDPAGVAAFAARAEGPGGVLVAVLGLGGIWDSGSVPGSRETAWVIVPAVLTVVAGLAWRRLGGRLLALAAGGLVLALVSSLPLGADVARWAVEEVPGAGLLRDSQKFLAPFALAVVVALANLVEPVLGWLGRAGPEVVLAVAVVLVALPVALLPDATAAAWPTVEPVDYPEAVVSLDEAIDGDDPRVVLLPWRSYRRFDWGNGLISSDPGIRLIEGDIVADDDLVVGDTVVQGESSLAAELEPGLTGDGAVAHVLSTHGIGWVVIWRDDPAADELDLTGLEPVAESPEVAVYRNPTAFPTFPTLPGSRPGRTAMLVVDAALLLLVLAAGAVRLTRRKAVASVGG